MNLKMFCLILNVERRTTIGVARNGNKRILSLNLSK